jgi:NAD(P)-dependent dehydrogenase (short-subunit alcohol dehydrogenase family)
LNIVSPGSVWRTQNEGIASAASIVANPSGVFLRVKYEIQAMLARGGGSIVNVGSGNESGGAPFAAPQSAESAGVDARRRPHERR